MGLRSHIEELYQHHHITCRVLASNLGSLLTATVLGDKVVSNSSTGWFIECSVSGPLRQTTQEQAYQPVRNHPTSHRAANLSLVP